ncbi:MAG TPA: hypothetical protein PK052_02910 [Anaerohalosphaeraceae bacterium]|nr:hypothetical protein [Phycisphaerae bacterium]HOK94651.1 hypothetical protein [Anaerohalosphaeraceae bacterium]HOL30908.1 hypothetical protein [Anaerohalosphaeraceae bacterium]HOM75677.1 hypothetical protein [Anaerohalosphaeraceae bacterium]HPC64407.1 hypothetical protein [Anaerohalosphaeraceae bacterium]
MNKIIISIVVLTIAAGILFAFSGTPAVSHSESTAASAMASCCTQAPAEGKCCADCQCTDCTCKAGSCGDSCKCETCKCGTCSCSDGKCGKGQNGCPKTGAGCKKAA